MKLTIFIALLCVSVHSFSQTDSNAQKILYGAVDRELLLQPPYRQWFLANYDSYHSNKNIQLSFTRPKYAGVKIEAYFGSWCGDSQRELPRLMKLLDETGFQRQNLQIIAVGGRDSLYKQSPDGRQEGKGIFRVPVFIIYKDGTEAGRINEYPAVSLEHDLLAILNKMGYTPNYRSYSLLQQWISGGLLADSNVSVRGLAMQLKPILAGEQELNSAGYVLLAQKKYKEAITVFRMNAFVYPESANVLSSLGEAYVEAGEKAKAVATLERSVGFSKDPAMLREILQLLYKAREIK